MAVNEKVQVDIVFNPITKELEKVTKDFSGKEVKIKVEKPDIKELEGPFKELQEKAMALANGGIGRGFNQIKEGVAEFHNILTNGSDVTTAFAGGLSKIGMEGSLVFSGLAAGALAAGVAFVSLYNRGTELDVTFKSLGINAEHYTENLNGAVNAEQTFAIRNALRTNGLTASAIQTARLINVTDTLAQKSGDLQGTQSLVTQALQGNKEAMYQLGITYNEGDTEIQRATRSIEVLNARSQELGPKQKGFFEQMGVGLSRAADSISTLLADSVSEYANFFRTTDEIMALSQRATAQARVDAENARRAKQDSENRSVIERITNEQLERRNLLAHESIALAQTGESISQQIARSEAESLAITSQITRLKALQGGSDKEKENRAKLIADLESRQASEIQRRNQLNSFSVQLSDAQQRRLAQIAVAQAHGIGQNVKQLSLAEQIAMAERRRAEIVAAIMLANGAITPLQQEQLANLQTFINQGKQQQAQSASQNENLRRQNNQLELQMRYENELARARGESYRTDIDSIDVAQRKTQIESALNGLHAYRGRTVQQEAARLAEIQRRTEELTRLREIENAQLERRRILQQSPRSPEGAIAEGAANSARNLSSLIDLQRQQNEASYQFALRAQDAQRAGLPLTNSQVESLTRLSQIEEQRRIYQTVDEQRLSQITQELQKENLTTERRIELLRQEAELRQRISGIEQDNLNRQQRSSFAGNKALETMESLAGGYKTVEDAAQGLASQGLQQLSSAFGSVISSAIEGKQSFGDAMQEMTKSLLGALAQQAAVQALFQTATGFGKLALNDITGATSAFTSAAMFAAVGAIAGGISAAIPSTQSSQSSSRGVSTPSSQSSSESNSNKSGPMIININMKGALQTDKEIQKAVAYSLYEYESRMGKKR